MDQIEQDLAPLPKSNGGNAYFPADSDVFEQPVKPAPAIASVKPAAPDVERGAKLLIRKSGEVEAYASAPKPVAEAAAPAAKAEEPAEAPAPLASITPAKAPRVVIIRRKPEDLLDVPLVDETSSGTAA